MKVILNKAMRMFMDAYDKCIRVALFKKSKNEK